MTRTIAIAVAAALSGAAVAAGVAVDLPDLKEVLDDVTEALGPWTYAIVGALVFLETVAFVGLFAPGEARLRRLHAALSRWGGKALVGGRFVGLVRVFAAFAAGTSGMPTRRLLRLSVVGVGLWAPTLVLASYAFADVMGECLQVASNVLLGLACAAAVVYVVRRRKQSLASAR